MANNDNACKSKRPSIEERIKSVEAQVLALQKIAEKNEVVIRNLSKERDQLKEDQNKTIGKQVKIKKLASKPV
jgi:chromosome segregation ATPase